MENDPYKVGVPLQTIFFFFREEQGQTAESIMQELAIYLKLKKNEMSEAIMNIHDRPLYFTGMPDVVEGSLVVMNWRTGTVSLIPKGGIIV